MSKPTVGIFGLTGCAGDQLVILNCEDELLDIVEALDIRDFLMASSSNDVDCELDIALVEGAVVTKRDEESLLRIRERARTLVALGTCAVWGGVAAMDRDVDRGALLEEIYGPLGATYDSGLTRALHEVVDVDLNISGCPIEKNEFLRAISDLLNGNPPLPAAYPVCAECKMRENSCLLTEASQVCLGPLTAGGCDARCPALRIACVGCRGPHSDANTASAMRTFEELGIPREDVARKLRTFAPVAAARA